MEKHHEKGSIGEESGIEKKSRAKHQRKEEESVLSTPVLALIGIVVLVMLFNQLQIRSISGMVGGLGSGTSGVRISSDGSRLAMINIDEIKSTGHTVAAVFPVEDIKTPEDAMAIMYPTGTPDYGSALGVSYDDPVGSLTVLSRMYPSLKAEVEKSDPQGWQRYMGLASRPLGISCEFCCGVTSIGIDSRGNSACGCQHNPALLSIALYLSAYSDYSDGEILREVMRWKTIFFPKDMIQLGMTVAGGDTSSLNNLPGMVGGC